VVLSFYLQESDDLFDLNLNQLAPNLLSLLLRCARGGEEGGREDRRGLSRPNRIKSDDTPIGIHEGFERLSVVMSKARTTGENNERGHVFLFLFVFVPDDAEEDVGWFSKARQRNLDEPVVEPKTVGPAWVGLKRLFCKGKK